MAAALAIVPKPAPHALQDPLAPCAADLLGELQQLSSVVEQARALYRRFPHLITDSQAMPELIAVCEADAFRYREHLPSVSGIAALSEDGRSRVPLSAVRRFVRLRRKNFSYPQAAREALRDLPRPIPPAAVR